MVTGRPLCQWALQRAEGACVMALGPSDALDDHSGRRGEACVIAILHVVGGGARAAGYKGQRRQELTQLRAGHCPGPPPPAPGSPPRSPYWS